MEQCSAYGKYRKIRDDAWKCLLDSKVCSLPVQMRTIAEAANVSIVCYQDCEALLRQRGYAPLLRARGFAYIDAETHPMVFFDGRASRQEIRFTVAHELGHIFLGHMGKEIPRGQLLIPSDPELEREADRFAIRILAPAFALWQMEAFTPARIAEVCDIPPALAKNRAVRMMELLHRNAWLTSQQERKLCRQFGFSIPDESEFPNPATDKPQEL